MNFLEFALVSSVEKDDALGAQLVTAKGQLSSKNYIKAELMSFKGITGLPKAGDYVIMLTLGQNQYVAIGGVEPQDLELKEGEVILCGQQVNEKGASKEFLTRAKIKIDEKFAISMSTVDENKVTRSRITLDETNTVTLETLDASGTSKARITLNQNGTIDVVSTGAITVTSPSVSLP